MPTEFKSDFTNIDRFIKFMKMTTSTNDGEALSALRRANAVLRDMGKDWEEVLRGKITIVADPFSNMAPPPPRPSAPPPPPYTPPPRPTYSQPAYSPPPSPAYRAKPKKKSKADRILNQI